MLQSNSGWIFGRFFRNPGWNRVIEMQLHVKELAIAAKNSGKFLFHVKQFAYIAFNVVDFATWGKLNWAASSQSRTKKAALGRPRLPSTWLPLSLFPNSERFFWIAIPKAIPRAELAFPKIRPEELFITH